MNTTRLYIAGRLMGLLPETRLFGLKAALLRWCGAEVGRNVRICSSARILGNGALKIGDDVWIGEGCFIKATRPASITVGSCCDIAPRVALATGTHEIDTKGSHVAGRGTGLSISVGAGSWLGLGCIVLPGVCLPERTLVAAGAVVTRSPEGGGRLLAGVPAETKRAL